MNLINSYKSIDEQIILLEELGLKIPNNNSKSKLKEYLEMYGFQKLINDYKYDFLYEENGKKFRKEITSDILKYVFDIDRTLSAILWKFFKSLELFLNTIVANKMFDEFKKRFEYPYICLLDEKNAKFIFDKYKNKNTKYNKFEILKNIQMKLLIKDINLHKEKFKKINEYNNKQEDENVIKKINFIVDPKIEEYEFNKKNNFEKKYLQFLKDYKYLDIYSLSSSWTFSVLEKICSNLNEKILNEINNNFFESSDILNNNNFLKIIEIFSNIRNKLAHNAKILDYKFELDDDTKKSLSIFLNKKISNNDECNIILIIQIVQKILKMKNNKISEEFKYYLDNKFSEINDSDKDLIKNIFKKYLDIKL